MEWIVNGFDKKAWDDIRSTIANNRFIDGNDFFGNFMCGALCFDIVLRDLDVDEWALCADAYELGEDTGYGYTEKGTPYDEGDGFVLAFDVKNSFEETLKSFLDQITEHTLNDQIWLSYANKTEPKWEDERVQQT